MNVLQRGQHIEFWRLKVDIVADKVNEGCEQRLCQVLERIVNTFRKVVKLGRLVPCAEIVFDVLAHDFGPLTV